MSREIDESKWDEREKEKIREKPLFIYRYCICINVKNVQSIDSKSK